MQARQYYYYLVARRERRDYAISAGCDAGFLSSRIFSDHADASTDALRPLFFFVELFTFYSRFNKGIMVIAIKINKRYRYDEMKLLSGSMCPASIQPHYLKALSML